MSRCGSPLNRGSLAGMRVRVLMLAVVALLSGWPRSQSVPSVSCALCESSKTVACPICTGAGTVLATCALCSGDGRSDCSLCNQTGKLRCPNNCREGKVQWVYRPTTGYGLAAPEATRHADPCRLCDARGLITCLSCSRDATRTCLHCSGTGKRLRTCWTCRGGGHIECPACVDVTDMSAPLACRTCDDGDAKCRLCDGIDRRKTRPCPTCKSKGTVPCASCRGHRRLACNDCGGTGKVRSVAVDRFGISKGDAGVQMCRACNGRGHGPCSSCKGGLQDCERCDAGRTPDYCTACLHERVVPCEECRSGGYARLEIIGNMLVARGRGKLAANLLELALERAKSLRGPWCSHEGTDRRGLPVGKDTEADLTRLMAIPQLNAKHWTSMLTSLAPESLEATFPLEFRERYWPDPPKNNHLTPWADAVWLSKHRQRVVARIKASLARARELPDKGN